MVHKEGLMMCSNYCTKQEQDHRQGIHTNKDVHLERNEDNFVEIRKHHKSIKLHTSIKHPLSSIIFVMKAPKVVSIKLIFSELL